MLLVVSRMSFNGVAVCCVCVFIGLWCLPRYWGFGVCYEVLRYLLVRTLGQIGAFSGLSGLG